ncbi:tricorn protease [Vulcanimicrobium alpinum]|uniref:Tricorn protease homolog n=1 Tax=Vulcanimicrobium alpinum TaxID=3016050 RepID=A0AAN2CAN0_UNVUL|nr:S41 family peptidase [Vulcanimicrobium alpinum]BDE07845.1 tricorn protease [Vulcanimicrobium alpinum]
MNSSGYVRTPTIAGDRIVFACEDDLWIVGAGGGIARRLTTTAGESTLPRLSPDGTQLAFVGRDEGHPELYVMPADGGVPRRLTYLGGDALYTSGWSRDGRTIFFTSDAGSPFIKETLPFRIDAAGGEPAALDVGHAMTCDVADGGATVLGRNAIDPARWKRYRGGTAGHLWVDPRGDGTFARLGREIDGNLTWPMWLDGRVLFLSDHEGIGNLYSLDAAGGDLRRHTDEREHYARFPSTDRTRVVYACGGDLVLLDPRDGSVRRVAVEMPSNAPETARRFVDAGDLLDSWQPSRDGTTLALASRGRTFTMPLWEEAVTEHPAGAGDDPTAVVRRRAVNWLHDDKRIAYIDDTAGYERIAVAPVDQSAPASYLTNDDHGIIHALAASPAGDRFAFATNRHDLWLVDGGSAPRKVDTSVGERIDDLAFSPDGGWLAYVWSPKARTTIVRLLDCETGAVVDATSPLREDRSPAWDPEGKYLYVLSTRDFHPVYDALQFELSFPEASRPYLVTLRTETANPFVAKPAPLHKAHDDDKDDDDDADKKDVTPVLIDTDGLPLRMLAFPVEEGAYDRIAAGKARAFFSRFPVRGIRPNAHDHDDHGGDLLAYDFEEQRSATLASDIDDFVLGTDGRTLVYASHGKLRAIDAGGDLPEDADDEKPAQDPGRRTGWLDLARVSVLVEPAAEWRQMLREAWRLQRENFWDPQMGGVAWDAVLARYDALLPKIRTRNELSDVVWEMQGELGTSHAYESGGDKPVPPQYKRGFLGADVEWNDALRGYTIRRILRGDPWNRDADSPLAEPGVDVREGDTIVGIGGRTFAPGVGLGALLVNLAGRDVVLSVVRPSTRSGDGTPRRVLVRTLRDERMLRYRAWVDANRATVHARTGGRVGYVHVPDMGPWGFAEFHRGYLSEFDRDGLIVDVRYNRGGHVSSLLLEKLARKRVGYDVSRWTPPQPYPDESVRGPIVALTNQFAGSDGDIFSHCFKLYGLGPLVGMRTWGGVVGINPRHRLVDGTETTQPEYSFWFTDAGWGVENYGTDPTHEVDIAPQDSRAGRDPQMDEALRLIHDALAAAPPRPSFPPPPNRAISR